MPGLGVHGKPSSVKNASGALEFYVTLLYGSQHGRLLLEILTVSFFFVRVLHRERIIQ